MDLEPVYGARDTVRASSGASANVIAITPDQERAAELQTEIVHPAPLVRELRTAGRVMPDEDLTFAVSAGVDGWVRRVFSDRTGTRVNRGDVLASFYSKEISAPQQAFVYALESYERLRRAPSPAPETLAMTAQQLATARDNLLFVGMYESQIEELARARREAYDIDLTAPAGGLILERRVTVGTRFMKGELLYRIASLEHVWVLADINPGDVPAAAAIAGVQVHLQGLAPIEAHASPVPPQFRRPGPHGKTPAPTDEPARLSGSGHGRRRRSPVRAAAGADRSR
jgi:Cu(I)/Ag(I) efflux system membrane fusion protein